MKIINIVGARPNFMKIAPLMKEMRKHAGIDAVLVHTGQHYDVSMAGQFFEDLQIPPPDVSLEVGSGSHAYQTGEVMKRLEPILERERPDVVLVVGDVNSTLAAALTAVKLQIQVAHVEAGLRSFDRSMPEEINRLVTDQLSDLLFTHSEDGDENLKREGVSADKIFRVGNVMIDSLVRLLPVAQQRRYPDLPARYALVTLHRPANVDDGPTLKSILESLLEVSRKVPVVFPAHPRTKKRILEFSFTSGDLRILDPLPYLDFLNLQSRAAVVITDSGGVQEETTYPGIPCLTVRENTERPITVSQGTNVLVGRDPQKLAAEIFNILAGKAKKGSTPPLWDGHAGERIAKILTREICENKPH